MEAHLFLQQVPGHDDSWMPRSSKDGKLWESGTAGQRRLLPQILFLQNKLDVVTKPSSVPSTQGCREPWSTLDECVASPKAADLNKGSGRH